MRISIGIGLSILSRYLQTRYNNTTRNILKTWLSNAGMAAHLRRHAQAERTVHRKSPGRVAEIKADAASIRAAILADFVPDDVALVVEPPRLHDPQTFRQQRVGHPQIQVRSVVRQLLDR